MSQNRANLHGIAALMGAQALLVGSDTFIKLAAASIPPTQIMAYRGPIAIAVMLALTALGGGMGRISDVLSPRVMFRGGLEAVIALMFITALAGLALGDITAILQSTPLVLIVLSIFVLGQKAGLFEWLIVVTGFVGVLLIVQPGANAAAWSALNGMISGRRLAATNRPYPSGSSAVFARPTNFDVVPATSAPKCSRSVSGSLVLY